MKEIKAFFHRNRAADVVHALHRAGFRALSVSDVKGTLEALSKDEQDYSVEIGEGVITEVKLEVVCDDARVNEVVQTIRDNARTGQSIAGWIYISDIAQELPIS